MDTRDEIKMWGFVMCILGFCLSKINVMYYGNTMGKELLPVLFGLS